MTSKTLIILDLDTTRASRVIAELTAAGFTCQCSVLAAEAPDAVVVGAPAVNEIGSELSDAIRALGSTAGEAPVYTYGDARAAQLFCRAERLATVEHFDADGVGNQLKQALGGRISNAAWWPIGNSESMQRIHCLIRQVAGFETSVLVTGESGTGKELVARAIHENSRRADKPFVPINCGAIPAELMESELFGHEKGAFTGAISSRQGRFEIAEGGTLFLDEIGDMPLAMQVKLLRVLQERSYERVGSNQSRRCDVRIIAATHRELEKTVAEGSFREDLFYRLNVFPVEVPALRERSEDLPLLISEMNRRNSEAGRQMIGFDINAMQALQAYQWPGNVRELGNLIERLGILCENGTVTLADLPLRYRCQFEEAAAANGLLPEGMDLKGYLQSVEEKMIREALGATEGTVAEAARLLGLGRSTLTEKLRKLDITPTA